MDEQLKPEGVTTAQLQVLKTIRTEPGASGAQLARLCYMTPQSAQALLKGLEDDGWITRDQGQGERPHSDGQADAEREGFAGDGGEAGEGYGEEGLAWGLDGGGGGAERGVGAVYGES